MFLIKRNTTQPVNVYVPPEPSPAIAAAAAGSAAPRSDEFKISFANQEVAYFNKQALLQLDFFRKASGSGMVEAQSHNYHFPELDKDVFQALVSYVLEKTPLLQVLSSETFQDLNLIENLERCVLFLHIEGSDALIKKIHHELRFLPLPLATKIYALHLENRSEKTPLLAQFAKELIYQSKLFNTFEEADAHFISLNAYEEERRCAEEALETLQATASASLSSTHQLFVTTQLQNMGRLKDDCERQIHHLKQRTNYLDPKLPLAYSFHLSKHAEDPDPELAQIALKAVSRIQMYQERVLSALRKCEADLTRVDLLNSIIGPPFLLDYCGFEFVETDTKFPFFISELGPDSQRFGFTLENEDPIDLLQEIEYNLSYNNCRSYKPTPTLNLEGVKPPAPEVSALSEQILPILNLGESASKEAMDEAKEKIIRFNHWDQFSITPEDLEIETFHESYIQGWLVKWGGMRQFNMKTSNFLLKLSTTSTAHHWHPNRLTNELDLRTQLTSTRPMNGGTLHCL